MSIADIQKTRVLEEVTKTLYSTGEKPRLIDIFNEISKYFSQYPVGLPLPFPLQYLQSQTRSDVDKLNELLAHAVLNLDVLYQASAGHVDEIMLLTTLLRTHLERLRAKRKRLITKIDDYLLSLYNTDGYYYSVADTFADLTLTDLSMTSGFVDVTAGSIVLPTVGGLTQTIRPSAITAINVQAFIDEETVAINEVAPFTGAVDGLTNTVWSSEVETAEPQEVVVRVDLTLGTTREPVSVSRVEIDPYGIVPVQCWVEYQLRESERTEERSDFGGDIKTGLNKMVWVESPKEISTLTFFFRKDQPDYTVNNNDITRYRYIFGAKDITLTEHVYDNDAVFVSAPLTIPSELANDNVIDAVALAVQDSKPADTDLKYYVAAELRDNENPTIGDFDWRPIDPLGRLTQSAANIVKFDGAASFQRYIRSNPGSGELQLNPLDSTNTDLTKRNPSPVIIPGNDIYRISTFGESFIPDSMRLEEGINSTRIMHVAGQAAAVEGLTFWANYVNGTATAETLYGRIDSGNEFFYGGDIGQSNRSVFVETYLDSSTDQQLMLKEIKKIDPNSRTWDVKVYLNGREVGNLPVGVDRLVIPWKFNLGLNHICLLINIPASTLAFPNPYIGILDLMSDVDLFDFGTVKLATWQYVDLFKMQYNETGQPFSFTILEDQIISRRKPTTNFRLKFARATNSAPEAIRFRADLSRSVLNQHVTPALNEYRLRFSYDQKV